MDVEKLKARVIELEAGLVEARAAMEEIADMCWDKRQGSELKHICDEACGIASEGSDKIAALLKLDAAQ